MEIIHSKEIFVVLIGGIISILGAFISVWSTSRSATKQQRISIELEKIKFDLQISNDRRQKKLSHINQKNDLLKTNIELIQGCRDIIYRAVSSPSGIIKIDEIKMMITENRTLIEGHYKKQVSIDDALYIRYIHEAKNIISQVEFTFLTLSGDVIFTSDLSEEEKHEIIDARKKLSEIQEIIRFEHITTLVSAVEI